MGNQKHRTVNKIENLNFEIDYDKLAEAIVKAEKKAREDNSTLSKTLSGLSAFVFQLTAFAGWAFSVLGLVAGIETFMEMWKPGNRLSAVILAVTILFLLILIVMFSILLWKSAKDIEKEKDKQFVVSVFSAIVGFTALVVALVALNK